MIDINEYFKLLEIHFFLISLQPTYPHATTFQYKVEMHCLLQVRSSYVLAQPEVMGSVQELLGEILWLKSAVLNQGTVSPFGGGCMAQWLKPGAPSSSAEVGSGQGRSRRPLPRAAQG